MFFFYFPQLSFIFINVYVFLSLKIIIINIGNIDIEALTLDIQLTCTYFLKKRFFTVSSYMGTGGSTSSNSKYKTLLTFLTSGLEGNYTISHYNFFSKKACISAVGSTAEMQDNFIFYNILHLNGRVDR